MSLYGLQLNYFVVISLVLLFWVEVLLLVQTPFDGLVFYIPL